jgi:hypothetical protein
MAHPYNKKYSNFNTPSKQSPLNNKFLWELVKGGIKIAKNAWKGTPKKTPGPKTIIGSNLSKMQNKHNYQALQKHLLDRKIDIDNALITKKLTKGAVATGVGTGFMKVNELQEKHTEEMKKEIAVDKTSVKQELLKKLNK